MPDQTEQSPYSYAQSASELLNQVKGLEERLTAESKTYQVCVDRMLVSPRTVDQMTGYARRRNLGAGINNELVFESEERYDRLVGDPTKKVAEVTRRIRVGDRFSPGGEYSVEVHENVVRAADGTELTVIHPPRYFLVLPKRDTAYQDRVSNFYSSEAKPENFAQALAQAVEKFQQHVDTRTGFAQQVQNLTDQLAPAPTSVAPASPTPGI